jgi:hypothetical protein
VVKKIDLCAARDGRKAPVSASKMPQVCYFLTFESKKLMARNQTPPPAPAPAKRSLRQQLLFFVVLFVLVTVVLKILGAPVIHRSEKTQVIERPHH